LPTPPSPTPPDEVTARLIVRRIPDLNKLNKTAVDAQGEQFAV
jgi:hypothetical protein